MSQFFNFILKIITLPFTIISIPFKILDWIFKFFTLIVLLLVVYFFNWFPPYTDFVNSIFPDLAKNTSYIKALIGLTEKIPVDKIQKATESVVEIINN
jgi:hypothetical protein